MSVVIPVLAGVGLALLVHGLPCFDERRFASRVEPYLNGLEGRPSTLLPVTHGPGWRLHLQDAVTRWLPLDVFELETRLLAAGRDQSVQAYRLDQFVWAAAGALSGVVLAIVRGGGGPLRLDSVLFAASFGASGGWIAVDRRLAGEATRRRVTVRQELPVAIDLLTLSIMAGEAVPQAFGRVGHLLGGVVGVEFRRVVAKIRTGTPVVEALQELSVRLPDACTARLVDALCTGIERGAPLADTLRAQADDLRQATRRDLLESGGKREILMLLPIVFLILPTIVAFTLLPGLVSLDLLVP